MISRHVTRVLCSGLLLAALLFNGCAHGPTQGPDPGWAKLREDFPPYLLKELQAKKPGAWPLQAKVLDISRRSDGKVLLNYRLEYTEKFGADETTRTALESSAVLTPTDQGWLIVEIQPATQSMGFEKGTVLISAPAKHER